jgi:antitoxin CcdA
MKSNTIARPRRPTQVTVDAALLEDAKLLKIDISKASEEGLARAVAQRQAALWLEANRAALQSSNEFVERHGLPLAKYRLF